MTLVDFLNQCIGYEGGPILTQNPIVYWMVDHDIPVIVFALITEVLALLLLGFLVRIASRPLASIGTLLKREWDQEWRKEQPKLLTPEQNKKRFISPGRRKGAPIHSWN